MSQNDYLVDASGEACPMPLLRTKMQLNKMAPGQVLKVIATDAGSVRDFTAFIDLTAHDLLRTDHSGESFVYYIRKN